MNEFTKEELGFLLNSVKSYDKNNCFGLFIKKIQSMIDNYCEHEPSYDTLILNEEVRGTVGYFDRCKKCSRFLNDYE